MSLEYMNRKSTSAKPRSAMFRSLVIFACLGHVLGQEQDPSCWLQSRQEATGAGLMGRPGTALDLLGSAATSQRMRMNELQARMKEEAEKMKAMRAELRKIRNSVCPSGGDYVTFAEATDNTYKMSNGDEGDLVVSTTPLRSFPTYRCNKVQLIDGSLVFFDDSSQPCKFEQLRNQFVELLPQTPPSLNISTVNVTFDGDPTKISYSVQSGVSDVSGPTLFQTGVNILDVSSVMSNVEGFEFSASAVTLFFQVNGYTLCGSQATVVGDPHIKTLDGRHFTLLSQGTFSLWRYSGVSAEFPASSTSMNVDWQVYAHYSGHQSYTKALLLLDKSGGSVRQSLEITSNDCEWRAKDPNGRWSTGNAELTASEQDPFATGLQLHTAHNRTRVSFVMIKQGVRKEVATLSVSCRKGRNINMAIDMKHSADLRFVDGELRVARTGAPVSTLQRESQSDESDEFEVKTPWKDLGGSDSASLYLQEMEGTSRGLNLLQTCEDAQMVHAFELCSKHLGADMQQADGPDGDFFNDCVFDVCRGGEVAAELAAELVAVRRSA